MTGPREIARVRGEIAVEHREAMFRDSFYGEYVTEHDREICRKFADQILAIKGIETRCDNQEYPPNPWTTRVCSETFERDCRRFTNHGWVKCVRKE